MADLVLPDGYGQAHLLFSQDVTGGDMSITLGYKFSPAATDADTNCGLIYAALTSSGSPFSAPLMQDAFVFRGVTTLEAFGGSLYPGAFLANLFGTRTGQIVPAQATGLVKKRTALAGRQYRGRMYMPASFMTEVEVTNQGVIDSARVALLQTGWDQVRAQMIADDLPPVLLHAPPKGGGSAPLPTGIVQFLVESTLATQRKRYRR